MKAVSPVRVCSLLLFLFLLGCEKEDVSQTVELQETEPPNYTTATVGEAEIAGLLAELEGETGKNALLSPSADKKKKRFRLDRKRAVKVTDSAGNRTFAMTISSEDPSPYHIYNLIVPKRKKGRMASFIIRYGLAHGDTPGSVDIYSLEEFTNGVHLEGRDDGPVPCYEAQQTVTVPTATNGGAAGNSTGYNNPFAPAINGYYTGPSVRLTVDIPFNRPNPRVIGGDGSFTWGLGYIPVGKTSLSTGPEWADPIRQDDDEKRATGQKTGKAGDCPEGELLIPVNLIDYIIINELEGKAKCVYERLQKLSGGFRKAIQKFDGEFPVSHLKLSMASDLPNNVNAELDNSAKFALEIRINENTIGKRTVLGLARTFVHETIHAEIFRKIRSVNGAINENDFPGLFDYYSRYQGESNNDIQHQLMASHYRSTIVDILKEFDNSKNPESFYEDLAWEGLQGTVAWNGLSSNEQKRIIDKITKFKQSGEKECK